MYTSLTSSYNVEDSEYLLPAKVDKLQRRRDALLREREQRNVKLFRFWLN